MWERLKRVMKRIMRNKGGRKEGEREQGAILRQWLEEHVLPAFAGRVLPFDLPAARILATYPVPDQAPLDDALIAAIAQSAGMTIATRNTRHFEPLGVSIVNPWSHPE